MFEQDSADSYCRLLATRHYENFAVASRIVPAHIRVHLMRFYAFCRTTDDLGDESGSTHAALSRLASWREQTEAFFNGVPPVHPVLIALRPTVDLFGLEKAPFVDLIAANEQDQTVFAYRTWPQLRAYCMLSAAPVGRVVLRFFNLASERAEQLSDDVCIGLQLANHAQDVSRDKAIGRSYILEEDAQQGGRPARCAHWSNARDRCWARARSSNGWLRPPCACNSPSIAWEDLLFAKKSSGSATGRMESVPRYRRPKRCNSHCELWSMLQTVDAEAERFCADMARREAKNFYWGFVSLPHEQRMAIYALYDFARQVDDDVDGAPAPELIPARLAAQRARIAGNNDPDDYVMHVLAHAIERYAIPRAELQALVDGVERDLTAVRYSDWDDLRSYCRLVASVVGRMCVRIFGFNDPAALDRADALGLALQTHEHSARCTRGCADGANLFAAKRTAPLQHQ